MKSPTDSTSRAPGGFTIVETLIVLAIAGLILLIVFEAIPTLLRSSRNNERKQDISAILETVSHYELNNSGNFPTTAQLDTFLQQYVTLHSYVPTAIATTATVATNGTVTYSNVPATITVNNVIVYNHAKCNPNVPGSASNTGASYSDIVALYALETGTSVTTPQCQQL